MKKVIINKCYGGYSISPKAALWLFEKGFNEDDFKIPADKYFLDEEDKERDLKEWKEYLQFDQKSRASFLTIFSPDEKFVLNSRPKNRNHPLLVECVETLGKKADGGCADLKIVEIPDGVEYEIQEYDGVEWIAEKHQTWG